MKHSKDQRQLGVQMIRIKLPFGRISANQLRAVADASEKYSNGKIHITTRQDIQIHFVASKSVDQLWGDLAQKGIDTKEQFGNTVRNITASPKAGIDPDEHFDITPYVQAVDAYFRTHELNKDLGRKVKMAFSSNRKDSVYAFMNDLGFFPEIKDGKKGFKSFIAGGMAGRSVKARDTGLFLEENELIPFIEAVLRVFSIHGESLNRNKGRLKFLIDSMGFEEFIRLTLEEKKFLGTRAIEVPSEEFPIPENFDLYEVDFDEDEDYRRWKTTNVFSQKQPGFYAVNIRLKLGNMTADESRSLSDIAKLFSSEDIRFTPNQGVQLKYVRVENLPALYLALQKVGLHTYGFNSSADITACPGTDTCNLGIANTTSLALVLEELIEKEYDYLLDNHDLKIKMSGCMNACGHHTVANIGLQATMIKKEKEILPAMHILLGGGVAADGQGTIAEKIIVIPTRLIPHALRILLDDFEANAIDGEYFNDYFSRQGNMYFFQLLMPFTNLNLLKEEEKLDWDSSTPFSLSSNNYTQKSENLVDRLVTDIEYKQELAKTSLDNKAYEDALYHAYTLFLRTAKLLLLKEGKQFGTQIKILEGFETEFGASLEGKLTSFKSYVLSYKKFGEDISQIKAYIDKALLFSAQKGKYSFVANKGN